jgi:hypothetical protein
MYRLLRTTLYKTAKLWRPILVLTILWSTCVLGTTNGFQQHPFCGQSKGFANHRQPRRGRHHGEVLRRGRIIGGQVAEDEAWPWQVRKQ